MTRQSRAVATVLLSAATLTLTCTFTAPIAHADPADAYVVVEGDSLTRIAAKLGVTLPSLLAVNQMTAGSLIVPGQRLTVPEGGGRPQTEGATYTVRPGDSLGGIAARTGITLRALLDANGMTADSLIVPDQRLALPAGATAPNAAPTAVAGTTATAPAGGLTYTVRPGDWLIRIASRHGVTLGALLDANGMTANSLILPGQQIALPAGAAVPTSAPAAPAAAKPVSGLSYTVRAGDSLSVIANRHGVALAALLDANGMTVDSLILPGRQLALPAGATTQPATAPATTSTSSDAVEAVLAYALDQRGKPYRFAAAGPDEFDCSGLTMKAYAQAGIQLPHQSALQARLGSPVDLTNDAIRAGDLVFLKTNGSPVINHVGLALTPTTWIHALRPGDVVRVGTIPGSIVEVRRFLP